MSDKLNKIIEAAGDTDVIIFVPGKNKSQKTDEYHMEIKINNQGTLDFNLSPNISPETLAYMFVRIAVIADGNQLIDILEKNGYNDVKYRLQKGSNEAISALMNEMTRPEVETGSITAENHEPKDNDVKSKVESAINEAINQIPINIVESESKKLDDEDRPFINALH